MYCIIILLISFLLFFYRKPQINLIQNNEDVVYSPGYGTIMDIIYKDNKIYLKGSDIKTIIKFINKL